MSHSSKSRLIAESFSRSTPLVTMGEIGLEMGNVHGVSKCHVPLRADDGIYMEHMELHE